MIFTTVNRKDNFNLKVEAYIRIIQINFIQSNNIFNAINLVIQTI